MQIQDGEIFRLVERLGEHYKTNISNRFIRPILLQLQLDKQTWDLIEILTEKIDQFRYQGFQLYELYRQISAAARFVSIVRKELVPGLRMRIGNLSVGSGSGGDRVLRDMAVNNFSSNLQLFADYLNELYIKLVSIDKKNSKGHKPIFLQIPELQNIGQELII